MPKIGTPENPLRVAIVGAGPSGFYAAEHILKDGDVHAQVDLFDRLPTPYGLVRGGVAPDHPKIKSVIRVYEKTAAREGFRFFGNVKIGHDIEVEELEGLYHAIVYTVGCETDRALGVPGEDLPGSHAATAFVGWYNAHPDYADEFAAFDAERHTGDGPHAAKGFLDAVDLQQNLADQVCAMACDDRAGRLFRRPVETLRRLEGRVPVATFAEIKPQNNMLLFFPSRHYHEVLPTLCRTDHFADGRFTINGWVRTATTSKVETT